MLQDIGFDINVELAARTEHLQYCPNLHNIEDTNDKLSIFSAFNSTS